MFRKGDILVIIAALVAIVALLFSENAQAAEKWNGPVQCSYYTQIGCKSANGSTVTTKSMAVAVPWNKVVSKKAWKKGSKAYKRTHFYYGEKIELKHGKCKCIVKVNDCGGFGSYGQYYKGKWRPRLFDLQVAVKKKLRCGSTDIIRWRVVD